MDRVWKTARWGKRKQSGELGEEKCFRKVFLEFEGRFIWKGFLLERICHFKNLPINAKLILNLPTNLFLSPVLYNVHKQWFLHQLVKRLPGRATSLGLFSSAFFLMQKTLWKTSEDWVHQLNSFSRLDD